MMPLPQPAFARRPPQRAASARKRLLDLWAQAATWGVASEVPRERVLASMVNAPVGTETIRPLPFVAAIVAILMRASPIRGRVWSAARCYAGCFLVGEALCIASMSAMIVARPRAYLRLQRARFQASSSNS